MHVFPEGWSAALAVCFCVAYVVVIRKREAAEDVAALAAAHAAGETMGRKGNMDLSFLRQVRPLRDQQQYILYVVFVPLHIPETHPDSMQCSCMGLEVVCL